DAVEGAVPPAVDPRGRAGGDRHWYQSADRGNHAERDQESLHPSSSPQSPRPDPNRVCPANAQADAFVLECERGGAAERQIDMAPELRAMLRRRRAEAFQQGNAKPGDYVFATQIGTPLSQRNASARGLEKGAARAGLNRDGLPRLGFHD